MFCILISDNLWKALVFTVRLFGPRNS